MERYLCCIVQDKYILRDHRIRVAFVLSIGLFTGCLGPNADTNAGCSSSFEYILPEAAEGFRWKVLATPSLSQKLTCLEIFDASFQAINTSVYRDSFALANDPCPLGETVVLNTTARGIATLSTTHVALLEAWDPSLIHWAGGAFVDYIQSDIAHNRLDSGASVSYGGNPEWDLEMLVSHPPSVLCIYPFGNPLNDARWADAVPIVPVLEYLEPHPLGRAEWMCAFGWLAGDSAWAESSAVFAEVQTRYDAVRLNSRSDNRLRVFTGSVQQGEWHAPGGDSFIAKLLQDAGADYVFENRPGRENVQIPLEEMIALGKSCDAWGIVLNDARASLSIRDLLQMEDRNRLLIPNSNRVFVANAAHCDYFGWWVARPDAMLLNLANLFDEDGVLMEDETCFNWLLE